ncbi:hypothetical protein Tco_0841939 [Tanacetum coccineum]|uniref:Uncharacterized protein n=1 Tax=Tanacetum coccineum TaxID=301880 RepID=A0ABQ5B0J0_9ASTR
MTSRPRTRIPSRPIIAPRLLPIAPLLPSAAPIGGTTLVAYTHWIFVWLVFLIRPTSPSYAPIPSRLKILLRTTIRRTLCLQSLLVEDSNNHVHASSHEFPIAPVTKTTTYFFYTFHSLGLDAPDQAHSGSSTRDVSPRSRYPPRRAPRRSIGDGGMRLEIGVGIDHKMSTDETEEYVADITSTWRNADSIATHKTAPDGIIGFVGIEGKLLKTVEAIIDRRSGDRTRMARGDL